MMNGYRESDSLIVSKKSLNNMRDGGGDGEKEAGQGESVEAKQGPGTEPGNPAK